MNKLPTGWSEKRLEEIGTIVTGNTPSTENSEYFSSNDVCFIKPDDLKENTLNRLSSSKAYLSHLGAEKSRKLPKGSVIVTCIGIIGKVGILHMDACFNQQINGIIVEPDIADPQYIGYCLLYYNYFLKAIANAPVVPIINKTQFSQVPIPLPPLYEQKKIASILEKAEIAIQKRKEANLLTDKYLHSVFNDIFGDTVKSQQDWYTKELIDLVDNDRGISYGIVQRAEDIKDGVPVVRISNIKDNIFNDSNLVFTDIKISNKYKRTQLIGGEVLISIRGTIGRVAIVPEKANGWNVSREIAVIPVKNFNVNYIKYLLLHDSVQRCINVEVKGIAQKGINLEYLKTIKVPIPPSNLITKFEKVVKKTNQLIEKQESATKELETYFNSLMQKAFRGELTADETDFAAISIFSVDGLKRLIKSEFVDKEFTYEELSSAASKQYEKFEYEEIKVALFACLEKYKNENKPFLSQIFDEDNKKIRYKIN